jgi:hypothetical protein
MTYMDMLSVGQNSGRHEMSGSRAILLAEKAFSEGRVDEARGLVELAYRLFDEAADVTFVTNSARQRELYSA